MIYFFQEKKKASLRLGMKTSIVWLGNYTVSCLKLYINAQCLILVVRLMVEGFFMARLMTSCMFLDSLWTGPLACCHCVLITLENGQV